MITFEEVLKSDKIFDASGIEAPHCFLWTLQGSIFYPAQRIGTIAPIDTDDAALLPKQPEPKFFYRDKSGRGFTANLTLADIQEMPDEENEDGDEEPTLHQWAEIAEIGDVFRPDNANEFTRIS